MQRDQSDQELIFKKRARRRLVGAIALVLLMVILLPMVLKDRAASNPQEKITITLPNEVSTTVTPVQQPADFDSKVIPSEPAKTEELAQPEAAPAALADESVDSEAPAKPEVKEPPKTESTKLETPKKFYVQIGVFSDPANIKQLQAKLSDLGYKSQTEKISTAKGDKIRLKTQVFAERNEAAIALENIKDAGLTGMVVSQ